MPRPRAVGTCLLLLAELICAAAAAAQHRFTQRPLIIAHRGSPCSLPEETEAAYMEAVKYGAHYLELDLVGTKGGDTLALRHDLTLDDSTNILELAKPGGPFAGRKPQTHSVEGHNITGFYSTDFTAEEIATLNAVQPFPFRSHDHDVGSRVLTIQDIFALFQREWRGGQGSALYMEIKHPKFHAKLGLDMPQIFLEDLKNSGISMEEANAGVVLQCFDLDALEAFSKLQKAAGYDLPLVWLVECAHGLPSDAELRRLQGLATYTAVGPDKTMLLDIVGDPICGMEDAGSVCTQPDPPPTAACMGRVKGGLASLQPGAMSEARSWIERVHKLGMTVHVWTVRNENHFLALDFLADSLSEMTALLSDTHGLGVDGVFVDCPLTGAQWRGMADPPPPAPEPSMFEQGNKVRPATAASVLALVGALVVVCGVWVAVNKRREAVAYKAMTPRLLGPGVDTRAGALPGRADVELGQSGATRPMLRSATGDVDVEM